MLRLNCVRTVSFTLSMFVDKPNGTTRTDRVTFDKTRLPGANDRHGYPTLAMSSSVWQQRGYYVMRGTRGERHRRVTDLYGPSVPIRPSHHITKSSLHKHDATPTCEEKQAILRTGFANDVKAYVPSA